MKNILNKYYLAFMAVILFGSVYSQTQISGSVGDSDYEWYTRGKCCH